MPDLTALEKVGHKQRQKECRGYKQYPISVIQNSACSMCH